MRVACCELCALWVVVVVVVVVVGGGNRHSAEEDTAWARLSVSELGGALTGDDAVTLATSHTSVVHTCLS
jgi:hypothetical protein